MNLKESNATTKKLYTEICSCHSREAGIHNKATKSARKTVAKVDPVTGKTFIYDGDKVMVAC